MRDGVDSFGQIQTCLFYFSFLYGVLSCNIKHINRLSEHYIIINHITPHLPYAGVMGCSAAEANGLGFVCFVVINRRVLAAKRVEGFFFVSFSNFTPTRTASPSPVTRHVRTSLTTLTTQQSASFVPAIRATSLWIIREIVLILTSAPL